MGPNIAHYHILKKLGAGGMGEVFLAEDSQLGRKVALKFLPVHMCRDAASRKRFDREVRAAAGLTHPNIVTIYEVNEHEGRPYFAMEYIEGKSLGAGLPDEELGIEQVLDLVGQLVDGLSEAHRRGVIHRDIKPSNVIVDSRGRARLVDFGLAVVKDVDDDITHSDVPVGTIAYMSPEQVQGRSVDERSDLFAVGVIMYQLITGQAPFAGDSPAASIHAIMEATPQPLSRYASQVPEIVERIVEKLLRKEAAERYQTAEDVRADLRSALKVIQSGQPLQAKRDGFRHPSIAVLPFVNLSSDEAQNYFCEGIAEEIINAIAKVRGLHVIPWSSTFLLKGYDTSASTIGRRLDAETLLEGSVQKSGNRLRISAKLIDVSQGVLLWSERYDRQLEDVFAIQEEIAQNIMRALRVILTEDEQKAIEKIPTEHIEAYDYYLRGRQFFHERLKKSLFYARQMFARAIEIDPEYALAYTGIADTCSFLIHWYGDSAEATVEQSDEASRKALELDPELPEAYASRGLSLWLMGRNDEADKFFSRAIELDSHQFDARYFYGRACFQQGRLAEAVQWFEDACHVREDHEARYFVGQSYTALNRPDLADKAYRQALQALQTHLELNPNDARALTIGSVCFLKTGDRKRGLEFADRAVIVDTEDAGVRYNVACLYALEGLSDRAIASLEEAFKAGFANLEWIENDPDLDPIRNDPRFQELLKKYKGS